MSCRSTKGGTASLRYIRRAFGLTDKQATSLFHALKREGNIVETPDGKDIDLWRLSLREQLASVDETESQKIRSERDLLAAGSEEYDGPTFYALSMLESRARQEQVINKARAVAVHLDEPGAHKDFYTVDENGIPTQVWYASYGSNLNEERFNAYLTGQEFNGMSASSGGARDSSLPEETAPVVLPGRLVFASRSGRWGGGGIAFLDSEDEYNATLGKAYKIHWGQFEDVLAQESGKSAGTASVDWHDIAENGTHDTSGLYGKIVHVGDFKGAPVLTFTSDYKAAELASDFGEESSLSYRRLNRPHRNYLKTIGSGLETTFGLSLEEQADYMSGALGGHYYKNNEMALEMEKPYDKKAYNYGATRPSKYTTRSDRRSIGTNWGNYWEPKRDYVPWWEDPDDPIGGRETPRGSYRDDEVPDWWFDAEDAQDDQDIDKWLDEEYGDYSEKYTPMAFRPDKPKYNRYGKACAICQSREHTMHDCPYFDR